MALFRVYQGSIRVIPHNAGDKAQGLLFLIQLVLIANKKMKKNKVLVAHNTE